MHIIKSFQFVKKKNVDHFIWSFVTILAIHFLFSFHFLVKISYKYISLNIYLFSYLIIYIFFFALMRSNIFAYFSYLKISHSIIHLVASCILHYIINRENPCKRLEKETTVTDEKPNKELNLLLSKRYQFVFHSRKQTVK